MTTGNQSHCGIIKASFPEARVRTAVSGTSILGFSLLGLWTAASSQGAWLQMGAIPLALGHGT